MFTNIHFLTEACAADLFHPPHKLPLENGCLWLPYGQSHPNPEIRTTDLMVRSSRPIWCWVDASLPNIVISPYVVKMPSMCMAFKNNITFSRTIPACTTDICKIYFDTLHLILESVLILYFSCTFGVLWLANGTITLSVHLQILEHYNYSWTDYKITLEKIFTIFFQESVFTLFIYVIHWCVV